jgi:hypothetical protein
MNAGLWILGFISGPLNNLKTFWKSIYKLTAGDLRSLSVRFPPGL